MGGRAPDKRPLNNLPTMAKDQEEIEDTDLDNKNNSEQENEDDTTEEDEDESEDEDSDADDSDEDDDKPATRAEVKALTKKLDALAVARRKSSEKRPLSGKPRPDAKENVRLDAIEARQKSLDKIEQKRQFGYQNNLTPDEVDIVYRIVQRPKAATLKDPVIMGALQGYRDSKDAKENTPGGRGRTFQVGNKDFKDLKPEEKRDNFADRRRSILESKKGR